MQAGERVRGFGCLLLCALAGCSPGGSAGDAGVSDASEAGVSDASEAGGDASSSDACTMSASGTAAFGVTLHGEADLPGSLGGSTQHAVFEVQAYFPTGRVAGAPVILAHPQVYPQRGLAVANATLDADLGVGGLHFGGTDGREFVFDGALSGPGDGLAGTLRMNFADPNTDVPQFAEGPIRACPAGAVAPPTYTVSSRLLGPTTPLWVAPSAPLDPSTLDFTVRTDSATVPTTAALVNGAVRITPQTAFPPNQLLQLTARNVADVLGRPASLDASLPRAATTDTVTDDTFVAAPPAGAVSTDADFAASDGVIRFTRSLGGPWSALVALGDPGAQAASVRVRQSVRCFDATRFTVTLVAADGRTTPVPVACDNASHEETVTAPGTGPLWLSIVDDSPLRQPQFLPPGTSSYALDEVTFL